MRDETKDPPKPLVPDPEVIIEQLRDMSDENRYKILSVFCSSCHEYRPDGCFCWNDE